MLRGYIREERAILYGITGGTPEYLSHIRPELSVDDNIISLFFTSSGRLFEEPSNLLKQELRNPWIYNAVIQAIASGVSKLNEIATKVGTDTSNCANQLNSLLSLGLVKKEVPVTETETSRKTIYRLEDAMFRFWYHFVMPNLSSINRGLGTEIYLSKVKPLINDYMGLIF